MCVESRVCGIAWLLVWQSVYKIVHSQFLDGVRRRYLSDVEQRERIYDRLVDFYRSKGSFG